MVSPQANLGSWGPHKIPHTLMVNTVFTYLRTLIMFLIQILSLKYQQNASHIVPPSVSTNGSVHLLRLCRKHRRGLRLNRASAILWTIDERRQAANKNEKNLSQRGRKNEAEGGN